MAPDNDPASRAALLDMDVMDQLLSLDDGELGLLEEMLGLYKEDTPGRIDAIGDALREGRMSDMADVAHAVKGSAGTMGAPRVRAVAAQLESAGRIGKSDLPPAELLVHLRREYAESVVALDGFVAGRKGS